MPEELTPQSFAQSIKAKYPQYQSVPDMELTRRILEKYPVYREKFRASTMAAGQRAVLNSEFEKAQPESTVGTRSREAAIGLLEPFDANNILGSIKQGGQALWQMLSGGGTGKAQEIIKGMVTAPAQPVINMYEGVKTGDYDRAAYGAGGFASQTAPAIEGGAALGKAVLPLDQLRDMTRRAAQNMTASSSFKTTRPIVEDYNLAAADTAARQAESDAAIAEKNRLAADEAGIKTGEKQMKFEQDTAAKNVAFKEKASDVIAQNREAEHSNARGEAVNRSVEEGSKRLGESVKDLDLKLREEGNGKYDVVRSGTAKDPGVPLSDMVNAANEAKTKLAGSQESIKQFNELIRKGAEGEEVQAAGMTVKPGDRLYEMLKEQGAINPDESINFKDLQGYSSELGRKLAQGNLPGDIYQALKYMKEKIDAAKAVVAERNGVGPQLQDAESFWHDYMDLFYDKDSSVTQVREGVGVKNPGEAGNQFYRGNMDEIAVGKLKKLRTVYAKDASAVADLARNIGAAQAEASATRVVKPQELPAAPKPGEAPRPTVAATTPRKMIEGPDAPTAENIVADKRQRIEAKGRNLFAIHPYDTVNAASAVAGFAYGHPLAGLIPLASKYGLSFLLTRPSVIDWIARPTVADLAAIDRLPDPVKMQVRQGLQQVMDEESAGGRAVRPAQQVERFLNRTAVISNPPQNRRDAMQAMGRPTP